MSQYHDTERFVLHDSSGACHHDLKVRLEPIEEYIKAWGGWATGQLTDKLGNVTLADVPLALKRLQEGFAFVGLTEEWELSVCLFHAKFGGPCQAIEFVNTRPTQRPNNSKSYDTSILNGWVDEIDAPVYAEAKRLFHDDLARYGVSHETCQACFLEANVA
eukprot:Skav221352  [mRNA]  locus=scaffold1845:222188:222670:+ [translate_table: standard]